MGNSMAWFELSQYNPNERPVSIKSWSWLINSCCQMSKKGNNPKAQEKRDREQNKKSQANSDKAEKSEASKWKDEETDKHKDKQNLKDKDREEQQRKRDEKRRLLEEEERQMVKLDKKHQHENPKVMMAETSKKQIQMAQGEDSDDDHIDEIYNDIDQGIEAHSLEEALQQVDLEGAEKHPQKRMKAAWMKYVDDNLPRIKKENSGMRRAQHLNMLREEWKKATENPFNQRIASYNTKN